MVKSDHVSPCLSVFSHTTRQKLCGHLAQEARPVVIQSRLYDVAVYETTYVGRWDSAVVLQGHHEFLDAIWLPANDFPIFAIRHGHLDFEIRAEAWKLARPQTAESVDCTPSQRNIRRAGSNVCQLVASAALLSGRAYR